MLVLACNVRVVCVRLVAHITTERATIHLLLNLSIVQPTLIAKAQGRIKMLLKIEFVTSCTDNSNKYTDTHTRTHSIQAKTSKKEQTAVGAIHAPTATGRLKQYQLFFRECKMLTWRKEPAVLAVELLGRLVQTPLTEGSPLRISASKGR